MRRRLLEVVYRTLLTDEAMPGIFRELKLGLWVVLSASRQTVYRGRTEVSLLTIGSTEEPTTPLAGPLREKYPLERPLST